MAHQKADEHDIEEWSDNKDPNAVHENKYSDAIHELGASVAGCAAPENSSESAAPQRKYKL